MSEWTPKVGDKVMLGEHGPYEVKTSVHPRRVALFLGETFVAQVLPEWLTPAPEPEPEEPTAPGALVRDGNGALRTLYVDLNARRWYLTRGGLGVGVDWPGLPRPVTVVLADPAEVEMLRAEVKSLVAQRDDARDKNVRLIAERDELKRRIREAMAQTVAVGDDWLDVFYKQGRILRGES